MKTTHYLKTLGIAAFLSLAATHCAAQTSSLIPNTLSSGQRIEFEAVAEQISNPCAEESLSSYKTLRDLLENGKTCHEAYILSSEIEFYLQHDVSAPKTETIVKKEAYQMANPFEFKTEKRPRLGNESAPVEIVIFSDFQCPFCARASKTIHKAYESRPDAVSIVFKHLPLTNIHPWAAASALIAAYAHSKGKFWEVHDKLFDNQSKIDPDYLTEILESMGADPNELFQPEVGQEYGVIIVEDLKDAETAEVAGTPTFFINGVEVQSGAGVDRLIARIDAEVNAPAKASPDAIKKAKERAIQNCPYPGLEEHYALLNSAERVNLALLTNSALCPCPSSAQTLHECAAQNSCKSATELIDHVMTRLNENASTETLIDEIDAFVQKERKNSEPME